MIRKLFFFLLIPVAASSQINDFGSWNALNTKLSLSSKWSLFNELQVRSQSFYRHHYYYEIKAGATYALNNNFSFTLGTGTYRTFSDGGNFELPVIANETRLWEQANFNQTLGRIIFAHRYRIEQRWFSPGYRNRFRYQLKAVVPLNKKKIVPKTFYLAAFDEIFLTNTIPQFERNRFYAGLGYQLSDNINLQPGFLRQYDLKNNTGVGKNYFQLTLSVELSAKKNPKSN